jgi:hypothetical protein
MVRKIKVSGIDLQTEESLGRVPNCLQNQLKMAVKTKKEPFGTIKVLFSTIKVL